MSLKPEYWQRPYHNPFADKFDRREITVGTTTTRLFTYLCRNCDFYLDGVLPYKTRAEAESVVHRLMDHKCV